jgi:hypothetical protein
MICPACGTRTSRATTSAPTAAPSCAGSDKPQPANTFEDRLLGEHLSALADVELLDGRSHATAIDAVRLMQESNIGSAVVEQGGRSSASSPSATRCSS